MIVYLSGTRMAKLTAQQTIGVHADNVGMIIVTDNPGYALNLLSSEDGLQLLILGGYHYEHPIKGSTGNGALADAAKIVAPNCWILLHTQFPPDHDPCINGWIPTQNSEVSCDHPGGHLVALLDAISKAAGGLTL